MATKKKGSGKGSEHEKADVKEKPKKEEISETDFGSDKIRESHYTFYHKSAIFISAVLYAVIVFLFSLFTAAGVGVGMGDGLMLVVVGTFPLAVFLIINFASITNEETRKITLWLLPIPLSLLFLLLWASRVSAFISSMSGIEVFFVNLALSYVFALILMMPSSAKRSQIRVMEVESPAPPVEPEPVPQTEDMKKMHEEEKRAQYNMLVDHYENVVESIKKNHYGEQERLYKQLVSHFSEELEKKDRHIGKLAGKIEVTEENFPVKIMSIEDKCKAINAAIGRVYGNPKGGSDEIRDAIRIPSELYNSFSEIKGGSIDIRRMEFFNLLDLIYEALKRLETRERDLFRLPKGESKIKRDPRGNDSVIDVLARNDKDPVREYHEQAKSVCFVLLDFLLENEEFMDDEFMDELAEEL